MTALVATKSLCSPSKLLSARCGIDLRPTQSVFFRRRGGRIPLRRCGRRDYLEIRMSGQTWRINAITLSNVKREVESLKSELRALWTGHFTVTEGRMLWTLEEKRRHEVNGHAEHDNRWEVCIFDVKIQSHVLFSIMQTTHTRSRMSPPRSWRAYDLTPNVFVDLCHAKDND